MAEEEQDDHHRSTSQVAIKTLIEDSWLDRSGVLGSPDVV